MPRMRGKEVPSFGMQEQAGRCGWRTLILTVFHFQAVLSGRL